MAGTPSSQYDPRQFLSAWSLVSYDTVTLHLVSAALAAMPRADVAARLGALLGLDLEAWRGWWQKPDGLVVTLSLPRAVHGTNAVPLSLQDVRLGLLLIAEAFGVDLQVVYQARVYRLDVAATLPLSVSVQDLFRSLVYVPRAARVPYSPTSIAFVNRTRQLAFYGKVEQLRETGQAVPEAWEALLAAGRRVVRYELRMRKGLTSVFGWPVEAGDLVGDLAYGRAVREWSGRLGTVRTATVADLGSPATVPQLTRALAQQGVQAIGAPAVVEAVDALHAEGEVSDDMRGKMRRRVVELASSGAAEVDPAAELRAAVSTATALSLERTH